MTIDLQQGRFLRIVHGAGSTVLRRNGLALVEAFSDASISFCQ